MSVAASNQCRFTQLPSRMEGGTVAEHTVDPLLAAQEQSKHGLSEVLVEPVIDIVINNVVSSFSTRCHLNLKKVALECANVVYRRENGMVYMKLRKPATTASIWSSGKITCTGATSEDEAKIAARKFARILQRTGFRVRFTSFRVVNVLGTCSLPFGIRISHFSRAYPENSSYEPELHPGVTYRITDPRATLKIFSTGSITVTAPCVYNIQLAIEHVYPLVSEFRMEKACRNNGSDQQAKLHLMPSARKKQLKHKKIFSDSMYHSDQDDFSSDESDFESDASQD